MYEPFTTSAKKLKKGQEPVFHLQPQVMLRRSVLLQACRGQLEALAFAGFHVGAGGDSETKGEGESERRKK